MTLQVRPATEADVPAISAIYAAEVRDFVNTYEYAVPDEAEMLRRLQAIVTGGYPYLVAVLDGRLAGYTYATSFRARAGYRYTVENSVYVDAGLQGRSVGSALMERLIAECEARGYRQMVAVIGDSANTASVLLHERFGFRVIGTFPGIGFKHGRWLDAVFMQRALGAGTDAPPGP